MQLMPKTKKWWRNYKITFLKRKRTVKATGRKTPFFLEELIDSLLAVDLA